MTSGTDPAYRLAGRLEPTRLSGAYRLGLVVVAITMLVLPLVYLGLIVLVGAGVWWHATANVWILTSRGGSIWRAVGYFGPLVAGAMLLFFMIKPVLARPARRADPLPLEPGDEPMLFRFINEICAQVRAPIPSRVQVDCQVNASASFATLPLLPGAPRLVLTIGLPLGAGLTVRQLGGVLAHEFGHFAQGGGMRLTFIVRSINTWFGRVAYDRDEWDEKLETWSSGGTWMIALTMHLAAMAIWCSRQILAALLKAGHAISCFMLRQMEYDADSYEVKLAGSESFASTSARMRELNAAAQIGYGELREGWLRRTLPSNLPAFLLEQPARFPPAFIAKLRQVPVAETGLFDTHPSDADRIRAAHLLRADGILVGGDAPGTTLFRNFDDLSARATRHHYEHDLGVDLDSASLVDTKAAVLAARDREDSQKAAEAFFGDRMSVLRALRVELPEAGVRTRAELVSTLEAARAAMASPEGKVSEKYRAFDSLDHTRQLALTARALIDSGFSKVVAEDFNLTGGTLKDAEAAVTRAVSQQTRLAPHLLRFEALATGRMACALALLTDPGEIEEAARLRATLNALAGAWPHLNEIDELSGFGDHLMANEHKSPKPKLASAKLKDISDRMDAAVRRIRSALDGAPGPDDSSNVLLLTVLGIPADTQAPVGTALVLAKSAAVRFDVLGRLAAIALRVEAAIAARDAEAL